VMVNLGCGAVAHPAWVNLDLAPLSPLVKKVDLLGPLPFSDNSVDAVYHAHVLEHFSREDGARFLKENVRVLRKGGTLRVVVPDLESICRFYLQALDSAASEQAGSEDVYRWALLELIDQMSRRRSGGEMIAFLKERHVERDSPIFKRLSIDMAEYVQSDNIGESLSFMDRLRRAGVSGVLRNLSRSAYDFRVNRLLRSMAHVLGGRRTSEAVADGVFLGTGEVHRWMYDRWSLRQAMIGAGCENVAVKGPEESTIADFSSYELDSIGGRARKPGSLYMEGTKA